MKHIIIIDLPHELVPFSPNHAEALMTNPNNRNAFKKIATHKVPDNTEFHIFEDGTVHIGRLE